MIRTERLVLRNWREEDLDDFIRHTNTPTVMRWLGGVQVEEEMRSTIRSRTMRWQEERGFTFWIVERLADGAVLGFCGLKLADAEDSTVRGEIEIGWRLREDVWRQGYAREAAEATLAYAFGSLEVPRVVALTVPGNEASWRLMERLRMKRRADLDYRDPSFGDDLNPTIVYEMAKGDWRRS